ncbi:MAG: 16S rRNA (cytidine(1402)-2'-O)-methyltransferase [Flavobacteriales bacterium]|nr:16S rRNA (cytidine(1402)-2'-O)-methyltransferase [Flavobacteriales bacterium]
MGKLIVVPTPIGNLEDITMRALRVLKEANAVLAEDTRTTKNLLQHYEIENKLISYHQNNEHKIVDRLVQEIQSGMTYALVSDAGTPAISDPGFLLVRACIREEIEVECLPGATAFVPALVSSGFPCEKFVYEGFLPHKKGRQTRIQRIAEEERTVVLYESPHRIMKALQQFKEFFEADRQIAVCREISKKFEEIVRGSADELIEHFENNPIKGEFVVVVEGKKSK